MNDKAKLENLVDLLQSVNDIKQLNDEAGTLYASMLVLDVEKIERVLTDSFVHGSDTLTNMDEKERKSLYDKAALLGCLVRFKLDLEQSTNVAKQTKVKFDEMKAAINR
jgi:hypothetical protein